MQQQSELPEGWISAKVSDICQLINGLAFKSSDWSDKGLPIVRIQNLNNVEATFNFCDFEVDSRYYINSGQLLFSWSGTPGTSFGAHIWVRGKAVLNQHIFRVEIDENKINKLFLKYSLNYNIAGYIEKAHGTAGLAHITKKKFETSVISFPPLSEQHHIVSAIEALFARLDAANERLDRMPEILKKFRQSVLAAACEGRLTEEWRDENPDVENANELPEEWVSAKVSDICQLINGRAFKPIEWADKGIPIVRIQNLNNVEATFNFCDFEVDSRYYINSGQLLFAWSGTPGTSFGAHIWERGQAVLNQHIFRVEIEENKINKLFLKHSLNYNIAGYIEKAHGTAGLAHITKKKFETSVISLPPLPEQHEIVRRVDALFALADSIEAKVAAARERTEKLRQSILAKAFSGELVETEAELARREGRDYERADVLLERIKAEQGKSGKKGKAAKGKSTHLKKQ